MTIKIGMILDGDFPPDDRPEKEALSLIDSGFEVHLLCYTTTNKLLRENYKGINITRFKINDILHKKLSAAYLVLPFYKWIYTKQVEKFVIENNINILHIHDLPMSDVAWKISKKYKLLFVCDQHEYWSNWIGNTYHYNTTIGKIVKFLSNWKKYEHKYLRRADLVITVSTQLRKLYIDDVGLKPEKIITIPNTPSREVFNAKNIDKTIIKKYEDSYMIFYAGIIDVLRGVDLVIRAVAILKDKIPNIKFVLAGRFAKGCNILELAASLGISDLIEFVGWLKVEQLPSYISASKICVFTPPSETSDEINNTIPTKIYQYAAMERPIVISNAKMMRDFVVNNNLGIAIDQPSANLLSKIFDQIHNNYDEVLRNVELNARLLMEDGNIFWEQTITPMLNRYQNLLTTSR